MSLLTEASLVITPNAVEEGKLFSIIPTDGSGDLTVTRATTATRVNSEGLIEECPYNLLQRSEQISTSPWTLTRSTVTTNNTTSPSGTATADELIANVTGSNGSWTRQVVSAITGAFSMSIYAKQGTSPFLQVRLDGLGAVIFDLSNGTIKASSVVVGSIVSVGSDGWYRCTISGTATGQTTTLFMVGNSSMNLSTWFATSGDSVYLWGAQLVTGSSEKEYFPTTDRLNVPRLDYTNSSCPSILVEPQRTNLALRSEEFDNAIWAKVNSSVTANTTISPDGTLTADSIVNNVGNNQFARIRQIPSVIIGQTYVYSCFFKRGSTNYGIVSIFDGANFSAYFDLNNGTIENISSGITATIENYQDEWYKCSIIRTVTTISVQFLLSMSTNSSLNTSNLDDFVYVWGAQLEQGSNATSYIPTVGSSVTRNADVISKTGIADLIGQTEGTIFSDINLTFLNSSLNRSIVNLFVNDANTSDLIRFRVSGANFGYDIRNSGVIQSNILSPVYTIGRYKLAIIYKNNYAAFFINGVKIGEDLSVSIPIGLNVIRLGTFNAGAAENLTDSINSTIIYKTALTDEECIALTTL
jgi:hypothetical protein